MKPQNSKILLPKSDVKIFNKIFNIIETINPAKVSKDIFKIDERPTGVYGSDFILFSEYETYGHLFSYHEYQHRYFEHSFREMQRLIHKNKSIIEYKYPDLKSLVHIYFLTKLNMKLQYDKIENPELIYRFITQEYHLNTCTMQTIKSFLLINNLKNGRQIIKPSSKEMFMNTVRDILPKTNIDTYNNAIDILSSTISHMDNSTSEVFAEKVLLVIYNDDDKNKINSVVEICKPFMETSN